MRRQPDPAARLTRALAASAAAHALAVRLVDAAECPWASATFIGVRLSLVLEIDGAARAAWLAALPEEDLPIPGRLVADCVVAGVDGARATLEVLLLDA